MGRRLKVTTTDLSPDEVQLSVEVPSERVETAMEAAFKRLVKRYRIPGFRPGRAPRSVFERQVGRDVLLEEATDALLPAVYDEALAEAAVTPFETGRVEEVKNRDDGGISLTVKVYRKPDVVLPDLKGVTVEEEAPADIDEETERYVRDLRRAQATLVPEETAGPASTLTLSGNVQTEGGAAEPFKDLTLHMEDALKEVREGLLGAKIGDERVVSYVQEGRKREAHFHVDNVGRMELPPEDDDFAHSLGYEGLKEMRESLTNYVRTSVERRREEARAQRVLETIRERSQVPTPAFLVEREVAHLREHHDADQRPDDEVRAEAEDRVRRMLVADALIDAEGITVSQEELRRAAVALMERGDRKSLSEDEMKILARTLLDEKLTTFLARLGKTEGSATGTPGHSAETSSEKGADTQ